MPRDLIHHKRGRERIITDEHILPQQNHHDRDIKNNNVNFTNSIKNCMLIEQCKVCPHGL